MVLSLPPSIPLSLWLVVCSGRLVCILGPAEADYNLPFAFTVYIPLNVSTEAQHRWCHSEALCVGTVQ